MCLSFMMWVLGVKGAVDPFSANRTKSVPEPGAGGIDSPRRWNFRLDCVY